MGGLFVDRAINDCQRVGKALLKFLSVNDVPHPNSHQYGVYLPKNAWTLFSPHAPDRGDNAKSWPSILWPDGNTTESCITWYGRTKQEYRLTKFGRDFPHLTSDQTGSLFVLIPESTERMIAYVFDLEDEITDVFAALGVEVSNGWGCVFRASEENATDPEDCITRQLGKFAKALTEFPSTKDISSAAIDAVRLCNPQFSKMTRDDQLITLVQTEYELFKLIERVVCGKEIHGHLFGTVDDFLKTAQSLLNRRKVRAGRSLENHFEMLMTEAGLEFEIRPRIAGNPDVIIPSGKAYNDPTFPNERLVAIGIKTTCKDRWRQILREASDAGRRFLVTVQQGISTRQLDEMANAGVTVVVPSPLHRHFARSDRSRLMTIDGLIDFLVGLQR